MAHWVNLLLLLIATAFVLHCSSGETVCKIHPSDKKAQQQTGCSMTFESYVKEIILKDKVNDYTTLKFLAGTHDLSSSLNFMIRHVKNFTMRASSNSKVIIVCAQKSMMAFSAMNSFLISHLQIESCSICIEDTILPAAVFENVTIQHNAFSTGLELSNSTIRFHGHNRFLDNNNGIHHGGGIDARLSTVIVATGVLEFTNNRAQYGGAVSLRGGSMINVTGGINCTGNSALKYGGAICADDESKVILNGVTVFSKNSAPYGGALYIHSLEIGGNSTYLNNHASFYGGALRIKTSAILNGTVKFMSNSAREGGAIYAADLESTSIGGTTEFVNNTAEHGGAIFLKRVRQKFCFNGNTNFRGNTARTGNGGAIYVLYSTVLVIRGITRFEQNSASIGGALYLRSNATLNITGSVSFIKNSAHDGGALCLTNTSQASVLADIPETVVNMTSNSAESNGGAILLITSQFTVHSEEFLLENNSAKSQGGAVYALQSDITFNAATYFFDNLASQGGGIYLTTKSVMTLLKKIKFSSNHAYDKGGAIQVEDQKICSVFFPLASLPCFIQFRSESTQKLLFFESNTAGQAGNMLYGGNINNCYPDDKFYFDHHSNTNNNIHNGRSNISSNADKICLCYNSKPDCSYRHIEENIFPGQNLTFSAVTVGQRNGTVTSIVTLVANPSSEGIPQKVQTTNYTCTNLTYTVYSSKTNENVTLLLRAGEYSKCSDQEALQLVVSVKIKCCPLSQGFEFSENLSSCVCANRLKAYTDLCNITTQTIYRAKNFWAGYYGNTTCVRQLNSSAGLILHPHCPFDYCTHWSHLNLSDPDQQCNHNRTGLLCGKCKNGLSVGLGTSRCLECSNYFLLLLVAFAVAGIILVFLLFACRLTVAQGTISGLIFYANIVHSNCTIFFSRGAVNGLSVFIAWLNLDLGIETCFYHGMDVYARTWLQFVFPLYIWMLCGVIIFASSKSQRISKALGSNPVAVLTTLFLLSYSKILRTLISALSFTRLEYPYGAKFVWLYDGNITYLQGKHIPLFIVALVALFLCLPYTILLLLGQWLRALSNYFLFRWMNSLRLKYILDTYNAPYKSRHCYWTGLLLVSRLVLLLIFATNVFGDPSINLLVISMASISLFLWSSAVYGGPYTNNVLNVIEAFSIANLCVLSTGSLYIQQSKGNQTALTYISSGLSLAVFMGLLIYNSTVRIKLFLSWILTQISNTRERRRNLYQPMVPVVDLQIEPENTTHPVTHSMLNGRPKDEEGSKEGYCIHEPLECQPRERAIVYEPEWNVNHDASNPRCEPNVDDPRDETCDEQSPLLADWSHYADEPEINDLREPLLDDYIDRNEEVH